MEKEVSYVQSKAAAGKKAMDEERLQETIKKDQEKNGKDGSADDNKEEN